MYFALSYFVAIVKESCQNVSAEGKPLVVTLQFRTKLRILHIVGKLHPYRIVCIVEEYSWCSFTFFYLPFYIIGVQSHRHDSFCPRICGVQSLLSDVILGFRPDGIELSALDAHREVYVLYGQEFHCCYSITL